MFRCLSLLKLSTVGSKMTIQTVVDTDILQRLSNWVIIELRSIIHEYLLYVHTRV